MTNPYVLTVPQPDAQQLVTQSGQLLAQTAPLAGGVLPVGTIVGQLLVWNGAAWSLLNPAQAGYVFQGQGLAAIPAYGPPNFVIVANIAALEALQLAEVGTTAYVVTVGALWSIQPAPSGTLTTDGITVVANFQGAPLYWVRGPTMCPGLALQQTEWQVDGQGTSGGNDENTGLAGSPLKTFAEMARRMGGWSPEVGIYGQVSVSITPLTQTAAGDSFLFTPYFLNGSTWALVPALPAAAWTGTIASLAASKSLSGNTALTPIFNTTTGTLTANMLLVNTTRDNSMGILQRNIEGGQWQVVQPMIQYVAGTFPSFTENNAWAAGDSVEGFIPLNVDVGIIGGKATTFQPTAFAPNLTIQNLTNFDSSASGDGVCFLDPSCYPICAGVVFNRNVSAEGPSLGSVSAVFQSCVFVGQMNADTPNTGVNFSACLFNAGGILREYSMQNSTMIAVEGVIAKDSNELTSNIFVDVNATFEAQGLNVTGGQAGAWYGPGTLDVIGTLNLVGGTAVAGIPITHLQINGATEAYSNSTTAGVTTVHLVALSAANLDAAAGSAGFGGLAYIPGVGGIQKSASTP